MKRVLVITYYWPPGGGAGVQRWLKFAKYLPEFGVEPVVLTVDPEYASYAQTDKSLEQEVPSGLRVYRTRTFEFYEWYKRLTGKKEIPYGGFVNETEGSCIQYVARFIRGNFFLPDPRKGWNRYAIRKASELIRDFDIDTVVTTSPPHSTQLIGLRLKKTLGIRWIADFRDPWTDIYYYPKLHHSYWARRCDRRLERKVLRGADHVITVSREFERIFARKLSAGGMVRSSVIPNGYDEDDFLQEACAGEGEFVVTYAGTISELYDPDGFLNALAMLSGSQQEKLVLRFVGNVPSPVIEKIRQKLPSVGLDLPGYVDHRVSVRYLLQSSLQLLIIPRVKNNEGIVPGKFFEYLASGKAVLAIGPKDGDLEKLIVETECGRLFEYDDAPAMAGYLNDLINNRLTGTDPGRAARYSRRNLTAGLAEILLAR